jgi:hypothetical protein
VAELKEKYDSPSGIGAISEKETNIDSCAFNSLIVLQKTKRLGVFPPEPVMSYV